MFKFECVHLRNCKSEHNFVEIKNKIVKTKEKDEECMQLGSERKRIFTPEPAWSINCIACSSPTNQQENALETATIIR